MESGKRKKGGPSLRCWQDFVLLRSQGKQNATGLRADLSVNRAHFGATIVAGAHDIPFDEEIALEHIDLFKVRVAVTGINGSRVHSNEIRRILSRSVIKEITALDSGNVGGLPRNVIGTDNEQAVFAESNTCRAAGRL